MKAGFIFLMLVLFFFQGDSFFRIGDARSILLDN